MSEREHVLRASRLLDSPPEEAFDRLTRLAGSLLGAPTALISLVDTARQFFKSAIGLGEPWAARRETPLSYSFCKYVAHDRAPLVVEDAREHPILRSSPAVLELDVVAYAGMPLLVHGEAIGALCVVDDKPRAWSAAQLEVLRDLSASVVSEIELRMALRAAEEQRALTAALVDSMADAVLAIDPERRFVIVNRAAREVFHIEAETGQPMAQAWTAMHRAERPDGSPLLPHDGALGKALAGAASDGLTFTVQPPGSDDRAWLEASARPVRDVDGKVVAAAAVYRDITERRRESEELRRTRDALAVERALFEAALEHIEDGVVLFDAQRRVLLVNPAYAAMMGLPREAFPDMSPEALGAHIGSLLEESGGTADRLQSQKRTSVEEFVFARPRRRVFRRTWVPVRLPDERDGTGFLVTWHDVTSEKALLAERERQLRIDGLTGIPNRRAAEAALEVELARMRRTGAPLSLALLDIDHFKRINDTFGHAAGDRVLCEVASTLAGAARITDTVARWGGEEFLAVLTSPLDGARQFCERIRQLIERLTCTAAGRVTISAGVVELAPGELPEHALARADELLYEAKRAGRNHVAG